MTDTSSHHSVNEEEEEEVILQRGITLLKDKQFSAARSLLLSHDFTTIKDEADIYRTAAARCSLVSTMEEGTRLMNESKFESSLQLYTNMPLDVPIEGNCDALYQKNNNQACCLFGMGKLTEALLLLDSAETNALLKNCRKSELKCVENEFNKAIILKKLQNYEDSLSRFDKCIQKLDDFSEESWLSKVYYEKIDTLLKLQKNEEALLIISEVMSSSESKYNFSCEDKNQLSFFRIAALIRLSNFDDALRDLTTLSEQGNLSPSLKNDVYYLKAFCSEKKGSIHFQNKSYQEAAGAYEAALRVISESSSSQPQLLSSLHVNVLFNLSITNMQLGNHDIAEQKFTYLIQLLLTATSSAISLSKGDREKYLAHAYANLGQILLRKADACPDDGREDCERESECSNSENDLTREETLTMAVDAFQKASVLSPSNEPILYSLGTAQLKAGLLAAAKESFTHVLHINPAHKNSLKAAKLCKEYDAAIEEQKQVELAKERELSEDKKRDEAETTAKTSPPKSPHQTAAFKKFNTPASSRVSSFRQDSSYNNSHTKQVAKVQEYSTEPQSSNSTHVSTPQNEATPNTDSSSTVFYSYDELKSPGPYPPDVTASTERELFLSEEDFFKVFKVSKSEFSKFPNWKKISKRKATGLF